jgi:hypothetical protein
MERDTEIRVMTLLPPAPDRCQTCAAIHGPQEPHKPESLYWQITFHREHGRAPTWEDAVAHLDPELQAQILAIVAELQAERERDVPD